MKKIIILLILITYISLAQKSKERVKHFNNMRFLNSNINSKLNEYNFKDSIVKFEELGPFNTKITNYESQGLGRINDVLLFENDNNLILAGAAAGALWKSLDYGQNWEYVKTGFGNFGISKLYEFDGVVYLLTGDSELSNISSAFSKGIIYSDDNLSTFKKIEILDTFDLLLTSLIELDEKLIVSSNYGLFEVENNNSRLIYKRQGKTFRSLTKYKNNVYFSFLDKDSSGIIEYNPITKDFKDIYLDTTSRIELENPISDPEYIYALIAEKNLSNFSLIKSNDLTSWININIDKSLLKNQLDYNLDIEFAPYSKDIVLLGGVPLYKSKNSFKDLEKIKDLHFDIHSIKFHPLTNDVFVCSDGGLYKISNDFDNIEYLSKSMSISQIFDFDVSKNHKDLVSIGAMDNGTLLYKNGEWEYIGAGDGMTTKFIDDETLITSYQRGSIFKHNLKLNSSELISNKIINSSFTPFYTNYEFANDSLFYLNKKLNLYDLSNDTLITFKTPDFEFSSIYKENNFIYAGTINGELLKFNIKSKTLEYLNSNNLIISEIKKKGDKLYISSSSNLVPGLYIYNLSTNKVEVIDEELRKISINSFDLNESDFYIGTDDGLLKYSIESKQITKIINSSIDIGVVSRVKLREEFDYLYVSTFSNGLFRLKLNNCNLDEVKLNIKDTISICKYDSIKVDIQNYNSNYIYTLNSSNTISKEFYLKEEGEYYIKVENKNCINNSNFFKVKYLINQEVNILSPMGNEICDGDSILISLNIDVSPNTIIQWNNGKQGKSIWVSEGEYYATIKNNTSCDIYTDTLSVNNLPLPKKPILSRNDSYQITSDTIVDWYLNDTLVKKESDFINIESYGNYYSKNIGIKCKNVSDTITILPKDEIKYYPNPLENELNIETYFHKEIFFTIILSDMQGKVVYSENFKNANKPHFIKINLKNENSGYYFINVKYGDNVITGKFLKL